MINREPITFDDKPINPYNLTPFGFYDDDLEFQREGPKVATFVARRLGFPVVDVELTHRNIYACLEEAITTYSNQVNQFNAREYMMALQGLSTSLDITQKNVISTSIPQLVKLSAQYGAEAESGGNVNIKKGYIDVEEYVQSYDIKALWSDIEEGGKAIEIRRIYHQMPPAIARYYDPFATTGLGLTNLMGEFGFDGYSPPVTFVMMPAYEDLLRIQAIEINDMIRKSQYSFKVANNVITFTPMFTPQKIQEFRGKIWFDYIVVDEKMGEGTAIQTTTSLDEKYVSDLSNIPYENIQYQNINQMSRLWIYRYTLATAKELLGNIRSKYQEIPIPDANIRLDGEILRREGADEKKGLVDELRETLEQTGQQAQMKKQMENAEAMASIFKRIPVPLPIFIG
jgi:hypothetical protein